jgi:esterase/lipase superfamily enzyme
MPRFALLLGLMILLGCAPRGQLTMVPNATGGAVQRIHVATARGIETETGRFSRERSEMIRFARYDVSVPPDRKAGDISWPPRNGRIDPLRHFVTTQEVRHASAEDFTADLRKEFRQRPKGQRDAVIFVHGFNNTFSEGLYRIAQLGRDLNLPGVILHYSWPSAGSPLNYVYDRDSALFARDGLEEMIRKTQDAGADKVILVAHSMGAALTMEALRQGVIRNGQGAKTRLGGVILISPDLDVDLFRSQAATMGGLPEPFLIFGSDRDRVLNLSARLTGEPERLGNLTDLSRVADLNVTYLDTGAFATGAGHFTLGNSPALIGLMDRLGELDRAFGSDQRGRVGLLPGVVLTVQSATKIILAPVGAISEELSSQ